MANPVGISYPIKRGSRGYFEEAFDTKETIKDALANLVLTPKKTRPGRPEYGCSLYGFLFEQIVDDSIFENAIREDIKKWIPGIELVSVTSENTDFSNAINLKIEYRISNTPITDELQLTLSI